MTIQTAPRRGNDVPTSRHERVDVLRRNPDHYLNCITVHLFDAIRLCDCRGSWRHEHAHDRPCGYYERELLQDKSPWVSHDDSVPNAPHHRSPLFFIALVTARRCSR